MTDPVGDGRAKGKWLWMTVLVLVAAAAAFWLAGPLGEPAKVEPAKPQPQSTEWAPVPEGSAVPVTLPTTALKSVVEEPREPQKSAD